MSQNVSNYGANAFLNAIFNATALPPLYLALLTGDGAPGYDGTILQTVEVPATVSGNPSGYNRQGIPGWTTATSGFLTLSSVLTWNSTEDWGAIRGYAITDSALTGNLYAYGDFATTVVVNTGQTYQVPVGGITIALQGFTSGIVA